MPLSVSIRASDPLLHAVLRHVCTGADIEVRGDTVDVAVLADPTPDDWTDARAADAPVVLVASHGLDGGAVVAALTNGANGVVHADSDLHDLPAAVRLTAAGGAYLDGSTAAALVGSLRTGGRATPSVPTLTGREVQILRSIEQGDSVKQTARSLGVAPKTVENLQSRLFAKLGVRNRAQAIRRAYALALLAA